jgi:hypothetical protein
LRESATTQSRQHRGAGVGFPLLSAKGEIMTPEQMKAVIGFGVGFAMLIVWVLMFVGFAVGNGFIAARLKKNVALWVILTLIPGYNLFFMYYVWFYVVGRVLHRLEQIAEQVEVRGVNS